MSDLNERKLRNLIGSQALRRLKAGKAVLKIWRQSSPHNWFVEGPRGAMYWHSEEPPRQLPDLSLFQKIEDSKQRIVQYWGSDSGSHSMSIYAYKGEAAAELQKTRKYIGW